MARRPKPGAGPAFDPEARVGGRIAQHNVLAHLATACHVECHRALRDAVASPLSSHVRSISERSDGPSQGLAIDARLCVSKLPGSPAENVPKIALSRGGVECANRGRRSTVRR